MASFSLATELPAWQALQSHYNAIHKTLRLKELFAQNSDRCAEFSRTFTDQNGGRIFFDFSKNLVTAETLNLLLQLAREAGVEKLRDEMFQGEKINFTEQRAVYHAALRNVSCKPMEVDGKSVVEDVNSVLEHMKEFSEQVRSGDWKGYTGKKIKSIVNIGIGGSDLYAQYTLPPLQFYELVLIVNLGDQLWLRKL